MKTTSGAPIIVSGGSTGRETWSGDGLREVWTRPLPLFAKTRARWACRWIMSYGRRRIIEIRGLEHVNPERDPFLLALNHNNMVESVLLPTVLAYLRRGKLIHFLADWNFQLIPGVGVIMRLGGVITVVQKPARPRFLNVLRRFYEHDAPAMSRARDMLRAGSSVGVFPEGRMNRDAEQLLAGNPGAARLALAAGVPIVPAGIRFPGLPPGEPIRSKARMEIEIGEPIETPALPAGRRPSPAEVRAHHEVLMRELSRLSGKSWPPRSLKAEERASS